MTAGRFLVVLWSVNGNGTSTMSAKSKLVVFGIVVVVPDFGESVLGERSCRARKLLLVGLELEELDEVSDLDDLVVGQRADLIERLKPLSPPPTRA